MELRGWNVGSAGLWNVSIDPFLDPSFTADKMTRGCFPPQIGLFGNRMETGPDSHTQAGFLLSFSSG